MHSAIIFGGHGELCDSRCGFRTPPNSTSMIACTSQDSIALSRQCCSATWLGVEKSASHQQSQNEISSDNPCSRHLSEKYDAKRGNHFLQGDFPLLFGGISFRLVPCCRRQRSHQLGARTSGLIIYIASPSTERAMRLLQSGPQPPLAWIRRPRDSRLRLRPCDSSLVRRTSVRGRG